MPAPVSIVIPTLNAEDALPGCLQSLMEGLEAGLIRELVVSDGGSTDATGALAQAWGGTVLHEAAASRGAQLRAGCAAAQGEWFLILHADTVLAPGWTGTVQSHLPHTDRAGWFSLRFDSRALAARLVAGWANLRSRAGLPYGDQGLLIHRDLYTEVGGYDAIPLMEDVALAKSLRGRLTRLDAVAITSAEKYRRQGWLRRGGRNLWTLLRYLGGASPDALAHGYRKES
jgi:rSAM/selenodomain-associated transferase 2